MKKGFTIVEVVAAVAMLSIITAGFFPVVGWLIIKSKALVYDGRASDVLQEGMEVAYNVFAADWDGEWTEFQEGLDYHVTTRLDGEGRPVWGLAAGAEMNVETRFERRIELAKVCRNVENGEEEACSGDGSNWDRNSRRVKTNVGWTENNKKREITADLLMTKL